MPGCARTVAGSVRAGASGCRSAHTSPASRTCSPRRASSGSASTRALDEPPLAALAPVRTGGRAGRVADRLGGDLMAVVARRLPLRSGLRRLSPRVASRRPRRGRSAAGPTTRRSPAASPAVRRAPSSTAVAERLGRFAAERGRRGLVTFAIDTELLGHWWWEGPQWLQEVVASAAEHGVELVTASEACERHEAEERPLHRSTWGRERTSAPGTPRGRRHGVGGAAARAPGPASARRRARAATPPAAPCASCWRSRRATGRFSTAASRPATTRGGGPPITRRPCSRPYTPSLHRARACETWRPISISLPCSRPPPKPPPPSRPADETSPDPLLGVPAADRGRAGAPRPQALRAARRRRAPRSTS